MYVKYSRKVTEVHTRKFGLHYDARGINQLHRLLNRSNFVFIDKGVFVNVHYILKTKEDTLVLYNQEELPISRRRMKTVKEAILNSWEKV